MSTNFSLSRFIRAQKEVYDRALAELNNGQKKPIGCGTYFRSLRV